MAKKKAKKKTTAKKAASKTAAKKATKKNVAKKSTAKKAGAKKTAAKKAAKKTAAKKATKKKVVKKTTAKKAGAKKTAAKKAAPKKTEKKAAAKKSVPKKSLAKNTSEKKQQVDVLESEAPKQSKKSENKIAEAKLKEQDDVVDEISDELEEDDEEVEVVLTDAEGNRYCRVSDCDQIAMVEGYCRYHYLLFWKRIQVRKKILSEGKLERYIEELTAKYPDKYLEMLRKDLRSEKDFLAAIQELELDDSERDDENFDDDSSIIDEIRGVQTAGDNVSDDDY